MKREINILITATEENGVYKCILQTRNVLLKDLVISMKAICKTIEEKGGKDEAKAALTATILGMFGAEAIKEMYFAETLAEKIEKEKSDIFN